ncbi:MAG TPA: hypothetical protein VMQ54_07800 [Steroidobacteraceae bacterium]|nr:hypothetical protein [Steroidobacteraceae bacterium]
MRVRVAFAAMVLSWTGANCAWSFQPAVNFQLNCMGCHLADGSGEPGRVPSIRRSLVLLSATPQGREFVIRVPGVAQSPLSDEDTAALLNWLARNLSDLTVPSSFADYSAAEIQKSRSRPLARISVLRARLMKAAASLSPDQPGAGSPR